MTVQGTRVLLIKITDNTKFVDKMIADEMKGNN